MNPNLNVHKQTKQFIPMGKKFIEYFTELDHLKQRPVHRLSKSFKKLNLLSDLLFTLSDKFDITRCEFKICAETSSSSK